MGKLNYTNRKVEGLKLGQIVAKDVTKRLNSGSASNAALRDPYLELHISGKHLKDEGLQEAATALTSALQTPEADKYIRLEELALSDNELTATSLIPLAVIISLACHELKDLDLSLNKISIANDEDVLAWETFLGAFRRCSSLRRLDLSGNSLGTRAFEVLARVYSREDFSTTGRLCHPAVHTTKFEAPNDQGEDGLEQKLETLVLERDTEFPPGKHKKSHARTSHGLPDCLLAHVPPAKPGSAVAHQLEEYDQHLQCRGIIYIPNDRLGGAGLRLLEVAEFMREGPESLTPSVMTEIVRTGGRRKSTSSSSDPVPDLAEELDRARNKIQGNTIRDYGIRAVDLWRAGLKMIVIARTLLLEERTKPKIGPLKPRFPPSPPPAPSYASKLTASLTSGPGPIFAMTGTTSSITPVKARFTARRTSRSSGASGSPTSVVIKDEDEKELTQLLGRLPKTIWQRILAEAADPLAVTSDRQREAIIDWARSRGTLVRERETSGKLESAQIWRVLDAVGCLSYDLL